MAGITTKANVGSGYLQTYLYKKVLENFEPNLYFYKMGEKPSVPDGYNVVQWAKPSQLTVTAANAALTEGVTPTSTSFTYAAITASPTQYGLYVEVSDRLLKVNPTNILGNAAKELGSNMARIIDKVIQGEIMAGTNVLYASTATNRAGVSSTMVLSATDIRDAATKLSSTDAPQIGTGFVAVAHPFVVGDLKAETATGTWIDSHKYAQPSEIFRGEIGSLYGVRIVQSSAIDTFTSTTTVYPTLVMGEGAYGVSEFSAVETVYTGPGGSSDPLKQRSSVGVKVDFAARILQQNALVRLESAATSL
jgi:N4-gp56 family major capsid protein